MITGMILIMEDHRNDPHVEDHRNDPHGGGSDRVMGWFSGLGLGDTDSP